MRHRILLGHGHLRERFRRSVRDEDRIESESATPTLALRDRPSAFPVEDLVIVGRPQEEDGLEPCGPAPSPSQELQDPGTPEALVYVRRIHAREAAEFFDEQPGVVDEVVAAELVVEDRRGEPDDLFEAVRLDLGIGAVLVDEFDADVAQLRRDLAELALVRRDEGDQVYRPRDSISLTFAMTASASFPIVSR